MAKPCYFLISVANRYNLDLCIKHSLAGFTNSIAGVWSFLEVREGDFVSFLYAARAYNLYKVVKREAFKDAENLPPWPPITFKQSGRTYYFPFRLWLEPVREFNEPLVRPEFAYVAENLLLRGGYRKTHFQADQTTLQNVSQMGSLFSESKVEKLQVSNYENFTPLFTLRREEENIPLVFHFQEVILQSAIRQYLSHKDNLTHFFNMLGLDFLHADDFEVLGEKALPEGHVDILIKESAPVGMAKKIVTEVKIRKAQLGDLEQLKNYMGEFDKECVAGVLIAEDFPPKVISQAFAFNVHLVRYSLNLDWSSPRSFDEILSSLVLESAT